MLGASSGFPLNLPLRWWCGPSVGFQSGFIRIRIATRARKERAEAAEAYLRISQARDVLTHPTMRDLHDDLLARQHADGAWSDDTQPEHPVDDSDESTESFNWKDPWHRSIEEYLS